MGVKSLRERKSHIHNATAYEAAFYGFKTESYVLKATDLAQTIFNDFRKSVDWVN